MIETIIKKIFNDLLNKENFDKELIKDTNIYYCNGKNGLLLMGVSNDLQRIIDMITKAKHIKPYKLVTYYIPRKENSTY